MVSRTKTSTKKRRHTTQKKAAQKKIQKGLVLAGLVVLVGLFGYGLYWLRTTKTLPPHSLPPFETFPSRGIETNIKEIDRCIYDALLALKIPADDVTFKLVQSRGDDAEPWTFSEMEIYLRKPLSPSNIREAFLGRFSGRIPKRAIRFTSGPQQEVILDLSINGHHTHRLVFLKIKEKKPAVVPQASPPRVAIIIDDLGYDEEIASKFLDLEGVMSFSVLPHSPFQKSIATAIHQSGRDVLVHLPMEPLAYPEVDPGAGALLSSMTPDELLHQVRKDLDAVPFAVGVNNHMGSRLTQDSAKMRQIFTILKKRNLFFVDSLTSPRSCCRQAAHLLMLKFAQRHVFLDHIQDANAIRFQINRLISIAKKQGQAIGIGHPYPTTWEVLNEALPNIKNEVHFVRVSELVG
ncbi:MAG: divergent polysaccharide deacetylase family protein [Deltaproteobacteria bacterium]|nr:divergent polysaccharide deacetylase family protein [Deltaproteobacteria bacterium]MBW2019023.1 divergent polysaccharide deacetylase family protein [Deltaproteobacteria bacterium]MBW2073783.1 divergent polysaccharide deacetylase family protein [Deltaproteobacteria bacterium]RLB82962.1 MAG: hypothetical protein DRH17_04205 [Deltaproteobacteria bacterium]